MNKKLKKLAVGITTAVVGASVLGVSVSAAFYEVRGDYGTFSGDTYYCQTTNLTNSDRLLTALMTAMDRNNHQQGYSYNEGNGGYAYKVRTDIDKVKYPFNLYYYVSTGSIYNSVAPQSGTAWSETKTIQ